MPTCPLAAPPRQVGTAVPSRPSADRRTHLDRVPVLSRVNGGLRTTRPTQDNSLACRDLEAILAFIEFRHGGGVVEPSLNEILLGLQGFQDDAHREFLAGQG